jgi:hypothetical protein
MSIFKTKFPIFSFFIFAIAVIGMVIKTDYDDYHLQLNGTVDSVKIDIQEAMHITVANDEQNLRHNWPKLQRNVEVGDSVIKAPKSTVIILIKKKSRLRYTCMFKEL